VAPEASLPRSDDGEGSVVVAVAIVRVVEVAIDEVVDVVSVRNGWVSASGAVDVVGIVSGTAVVRGAH
jgi:hypothetical protein